MYLEEAWLTDPKMDQGVADYIRGVSRQLPQGPGELYDWGWLKFIPEGVWLYTSGRPLLETLQVIADKARGLYNLEPIRQRLASDFHPEKLASWAAGGGKLRIAMVGLESGQLRYATETRDMIERDGSAVVDLDHVAAPCAKLASQLAALEGEISALRTEINDLQAELRSAPPPAKAGLVAQIRRLEEQIRQKSPPLNKLRVELAACAVANPLPFRLPDIRDGILASASIPGIFLPVKIGREYYVDGGIREVVPIQAAVDLGANNIYVVSASTTNLPPYTTPIEAGIFDIVARSLEQITINEMDRNDRQVQTKGGQPAPAIVSIEPEIDLHDITVIDPGLIQICRDYGYMCAADTIDRPADGNRQQLATAIAVARRDIWRLENTMAGQPDPTTPSAPVLPPNPGLGATISAKKGELGNLIGQRRAANGPVPSGIDYWVAHPELHPWGPVSGNSATFVSQNAPNTMAPGAVAAVSVAFRNAGRSIWQANKNYRLGSQAPQDNQHWGPARVELPKEVPPGEDVTFNFNITAPATSGHVSFQWRMVQDAVEYFGDYTPSLDIAVGHDSPECNDIRAKISKCKQDIAQLEEQLTGDPHHDTTIKAKIAGLKLQISNLQQRAQQIGCAV